MIFKGTAVWNFKAIVLQVWAAVPPWKQGSLAEFVNLTEFEVSAWLRVIFKWFRQTLRMHSHLWKVSHKPKCLSHMEAASIPYVASTVLSALVNAGGLCRDSSSNKRQAQLSRTVWKSRTAAFNHVLKTKKSTCRWMPSSQLLTFLSRITIEHVFFFLLEFWLREAQEALGRLQFRWNITSSNSGLFFSVCVCLWLFQCFLSFCADSWQRPGVPTLQSLALRTPRVSSEGSEPTRWWTTPRKMRRTTSKWWRGAWHCSDWWGGRKANGY